MNEELSPTNKAILNARVISLLNEAIALLSGGQNFPATQAGVDAASAQYLRENPDVAAHVYFAKHPLEHWQLHGKHEGRKWPAMAPVVEPDEPTEPEVREPTVTGDSPELRNFRHLKETLGDDAAYDYLVKHVPNGGNLVRDMFADRAESARVVNKYGVGAQRGYIDGDEYVFGGNPFTKEGGTRVKLPG